MEIIEPRVRARRGRTRAASMAQASNEPAPPPYVPKREAVKIEVILHFTCTTCADCIAFLQKAAPINYDHLNFDLLDDDFVGEPTDDFFVGALKGGMENGTIVISDDDYDPDEYEEEDDDTKNGK